MSRESYIVDRKTGKLVPRDEYYRQKAERSALVVRDCEPFLSMADGKTIIRSRSHYREHLKDHGMVEVGNQPAKPYTPPPLPPVTPILKDAYQNRHSPDALYNIARAGRTKD